MSIRKNFVMLSLLCVLAFFSLQLDSARAASCPHCGQYYPPAAPGDWARVEALRRDHERSCSRGGDPDPVRSISAVNIHNQTTSPITYKIYTQGRWQQETIAANGGSYFHWQWPARQFRVSYNGVQYNIRFTSFRQAADPVKSQGKK